MKKILIAAGLMGLLCPSFVLAVPPNNMKTDYPEIYFDQKAGAFLLKAYADLKVAATVVVADRKGGRKFNGGEDAFVTGSDSTKHPFGAFGTWGAMVGEDRTKSGHAAQITLLNVASDGQPVSFIESINGVDLVLTLGRAGVVFDFFLGRIMSDRGHISFVKDGPASWGKGSPDVIYGIKGANDSVGLLSAVIKGNSRTDVVDRIQDAYLQCKDRGHILDFVAYVLMDNKGDYSLPPAKASVRGVPTVLSGLKPSAFAGCNKGGL